ncbi:exonuclease domain-containing protein [Fructobacillus sp. W13]|uniref:Exonuclease domain-containing protein n=1 Tax=Fructobacillus apis TaxID=2935017 RepID=A0ABT0ZNQ2_9LACO|nr:exonuclease domain-containing protein [Fructobacillus apis]MCO0831613.1 exonuclease domain-containing protein [Fructobacillus apis]
MKESAAFVIVDLETTSPSVENGGRIIQIGMTFVKNKKIVEHFDSFVNPAQPIDKKIQQLTHISPKDVQDAPFFEEIAPSLQALLKGQVFVAHNVNFDLPYLNAEFERVGLPAMDLKAIDTVQLAQIMFPTAPGYRLSDLTTYLDLPLVQAHRANADAEATAHLMLAIWQKAQSLPEKTKRALLSMDWGLLRESQEFLKMACKSKGSFEEVAEGALKKVNHESPFKKKAKKEKDQKQTTFPRSMEEKRAILGPDLDIDEQRNEVMNTTNDLLARSQKEVTVLTTPPRLKKTGAYLFPLFFQKRNKATWLISDDIGLIVHQKMMLQNICERLPKQMISYVSLYKPEGYLDETKFRASLKKASTSGASFWQAQILVWLSETPTASFAELPRGLRAHQDLKSVAADENSKVFQTAFELAEKADVVLTTYDSFFGWGKKLADAQDRSDKPAVILEKPMSIKDAFQDAVGLTLPLGFYQDQVAKVADQAAQLPAKLRGRFQVALHNWSVACQKIDQNLTEKDALKAGKAILDRLLSVLELVNKANLNTRLADYELVQKREKLAFLAAHQEVIKKTFWKIDDEKGQQEIHFEVDEKKIYQRYFLKQVSQVLAVSSFYPEDVESFLQAVPRGVFLPEESQTLQSETQLKTILSTEKNEDKQLLSLFEANRDHILVITEDEASLRHWYFKLSAKYGEEYVTYGQDLSAPLKKAAWQASGEEKSILVVDQDYFSALFEQNVPVPEVAFIPRANRWADTDDLLQLTMALQKDAHSLLLSPLSQGQLKGLSGHLAVMNPSRKVMKKKAFER